MKSAQKEFDEKQQIMKSRGQKTLFLIQLNFDGCLISNAWKSGKKIQIPSRLAADFNEWESDNEKFEKQFERGAKANRADEGEREMPPESML